MGFSRALRSLGGAALAGALVVGVAPVAHADDARNAQWALSDYQASSAVWPKSTGKGVTVAVIDSGVRATHVDLRGQVLSGKDFAYGGDGQTDHSPEFHGTLVASLIAGHGHGPNGEDGIMGLAPGAKILPVGIGSEIVTTGGTDYTAQAVRYAVDHGAQVINMSIGGADSDAVTEAAMAYAEEHNVVLVAASGNDGVSLPTYPASYPGVIKVGAVGKNAKLWSSSNTGGITVVAPGVQILGDGGDSDTGYRMGDGTSFAAPYVSAIAALYRSAHPNLTAGQIVNYIIKTAIPPQGMKTPDPAYGYGIASPDLNMAVAPGPAAGPLPQSSPLPGGASASSGSSSTPATPGTTNNASSSSGGSSMGLILGVLGGLVVLVIIVIVVVRSRRGGGGGGSGSAGGGGGQPLYPQPQAYQPPTGQYGQGSPYGQQPPQQQNPYGGAQNPQQYPPQQGYGGQSR